jgi:hypothetical protein
MGRRVAVLAVGAEVVAKLEGMAAHDLGERRLNCIDVMRPNVATTIADYRKSADFKARQIPVITKERRRLRGEAQALRIELALVLPDVIFNEAREPNACVENRRRRESIDVVVAKAIILTSQKVPVERRPLTTPDQALRASSRLLCV